MEFNYERLKVTQITKRLITKIYRITERFPQSEMYCLVSQLRRAAISILLNLAEGSNRQTKKDFNRFVRMSIGSLVEADAALKVSIDLLYLTEAEYNELEPEIKELYFKLIGLCKYLNE